MTEYKDGAKVITCTITTDTGERNCDECGTPYNINDEYAYITIKKSDLLAILPEEWFRGREYYRKVIRRNIDKLIEGASKRKRKRELNYSAKCRK